MLKDYLRDDLSSCSSNGFQSFPRRSQCCTTVRFLLEIDLKTKHVYKSNQTKHQEHHLKRSRSKSAASTTISALQKAVINAVKLLPFPTSVKSPSSQSVENRTRKGGPLPRSLSRKLFKKSFWRKPDHHHQREENEMGRCRLFREFLTEQDKQSDIQTTVITSRISTSSSSNSKSWTSESDFTGHSGNSIPESFNSANDAAEGKTDLLPNEKKGSSSNKVGVTDGEDSIKYSSENTKASKELFI